MNSPRDVKLPTLPGPLFQTNDEAQNWMLDLASGVREARARMDLEPDASQQRKLYTTLIMRYGSAKGALDALFRCGRVTESFHTTVANELLRALAERVTVVDSGKLVR